MATINMSSIMGKVKSWSKTPVGKKTMSTATLPESKMEEAASKLCYLIRYEAASHGLPESISDDISSVEYTRPYKTGENEYTVFIEFRANLHRDSLYPEGYDGVDNIIALFNNGYTARNYVYGWWDKHKATDGNVADTRNMNGFGDYVWTRSLLHRGGLHFIQQAVHDFDGNYAYMYPGLSIEINPIYK